MSRLLLLLPFLLLATPALAHDRDDDGTCEDDEVPAPPTHHRDPDRSVAGDLSSRWVHVGGGFGGVGPGVTDRGAASYGAGRFVVGGGGYTFLLYGGSEFAATTTAIEPLRLEGAGYIGVALPVPVFHPLLGVRGAVGGHFTGTELLPQLSVGPQVGFILRKFDGRPGLRLMVDGGANIRPVEREIVPEVFVTVAGVF